MSKTDEDIGELPYDYSYYGEYYPEGEEYYGQEEEEESIYNSDDFISGPTLSENSTLPTDILEFDFSYGYDCRKYYNIVTPDKDTVVFVSGNFINFLDVNTKKITFRRSALGGGIGHMAVNPNEDYHHLAVAENGRKPLIIIYEWPSLEINCILRDGSSRLYSYIDYSPSGELLVSQGGEPDYLITVFNWPKHRILLRTKSYVNDVYRVKFSPYVPGHLTSCGMGHIKFWKMARTFTGLKLKGELGRFGKTEYSDILGILPMPDEKVVSGCYWGNTLIWDAGLIKLEVFRTLRRKCHEAPIVQFFYIDGELWTVSMDGHVRVWSYEKIDQADPPDDDRVVQIEPTYDFTIPGVMLMSIKKRVRDPEDVHYFAQDGNGGIWIIDLNVRTSPRPPERVYMSHAGPVLDIAACPYGDYFASIGKGGRLHVYDYKRRTLIFTHQFPAVTTCIIWFPLSVQPYGDQLVVGCDDGTVRVVLLQIDSINSSANLDVVQILKPHNKPITAISLNQVGDVLVTGSEDSTIFIFQVVKEEPAAHLIPIGYTSAPDVVTCITWHHFEDDVVLVGCLHGHFMQVAVPKEPQEYTQISYLLKIQPINRRFLTYKAQIRRDIKIREIEARKALKVERKRKEMEKIKAENPGLEIDEEAYLADSDSEEELEPLHIPEIPNKILWIQSTREETIWLSMGGYDAGYIYEYKIDQREDTPYRFKMVHDADDIEISSFVYTKDQKYLIFAMQDGTIRVNKINLFDYRDLTDYWTLALHDNINGYVPKMCFNYNERYLFTCGHDGNIFSYKFNATDIYRVSSIKMPRAEKRVAVPQFVKDEDFYKIRSLEETMIKAENDRIEELANKHKDILRERIKKLEIRFYKNILMRNDKLLPSQKITQEQLELDKRLTRYIDKTLQDKLDLVKRKLAFEVEKSEVGMNKLLKHFIEPLEKFPIDVTAIKTDSVCKTIRQRRVPPEFYDMQELAEEKIKEAEVRGRPPERPQQAAKPPPPKKKREKKLEYFLMSLSPAVIQQKLGARLTRMLAKYRDRKTKWENRQDQWEEFNARKPPAGGIFPEDEVLLNEATAAIGDYKLKSEKGYRVPPHLRETTVKKYKQLLAARKRQLILRSEYNDKVYELRDKKVKLRDTIKNMMVLLKDIQTEIPEQTIIEPPIMPEEDVNDFPERNLVPVVNIPESEMSLISNTQISKPIVEPPNTDALEKEILFKRQVPKEVSCAPIIEDTSIKAMLECDIQELIKYSENSKKDNPWEKEMRHLRLHRKVFEQTELIKTIEASIDHFDNSLESLKMERQATKVNGNFIDLHILFLNQELVVLKEFESREEELSEAVNSKLSQVLDMQDMIDSLNNQIEEENNEIVSHNEKIVQIQDNFKKATSENKFFDFLRKVFKKKYKPPKTKTDDSSSESSSSSSSDESDEEGDAGSIDSRDFGIIKQDLNVCPKGCEQAIYDLTVSLRTERHQLEIAIKETLKNIELIRKDAEIATKKIRILTQNLKISQEESEAFQREKQQNLNKIFCTVLVKLDQIQNLDEEKAPIEIEQTLVFSKTKLSQLYKRVGELETEAIQQANTHAANMRHLSRMKTDCKFMQKRIEQLKGDVVNMTLIKFGKVVDVMEIHEALLKRTFGKDDINDLVEVLLKKLVHDLRISLMDIKGMYAAETSLWKQKVINIEEELIATYKDNSNRMDLLTALNEEKIELGRIVQNQRRKMQHINELIKSSEEHSIENKRLDGLVKKQKKQIQDLKDAIKMLRTKGMPSKSEIELARKTHKRVKAKEEEESDDWIDYDEYLARRAASTVSDESEEKPEPSTEIIMPFVAVESEEAVRGIIEEMLDGLGTILARRSIENMVKDVIHIILSRGSIHDIVKQLVDTLPVKMSDERLSIVETSAEKLYGVQEPEVTEDDLTLCVREIVQEVLDKVALETQDSEEFIYYTVQGLLEHLPYKYVRRSSSIEYISDLLKEKMDSAILDGERIKAALARMQDPSQREAMEIMNLILERVYGEGLDYLYYHGDEELYYEEDYEEEQD